MKPIVLKADQDGKILISAEEIEKLVSDAYDEGYRDGKAAAPITVSPGISTPQYPWYDHVHITCQA